MRTKLLLKVFCSFLIEIILSAKILNAQVTLQGISPFPFGASININLLKNNPIYRATAAREYNSLTAENAMKFDAIHPAQNTYNFVDGDTLVNFAQQTGKRIHGHTLIWHNQLPQWVTNFVGDSAAWENIMQTHIQTVVTHYIGKVVSWDVVNEAFKDDGTLRNAGIGGSLWMQHLGPNYIARAFQYAHQADPNALLFYNDYGHDYSTAKLTAIANLINNLVASGIPVNGVGLQMHLDKNTSYNNLANAINVMTQTGLKVHLSELDVALNPENNQSATFTPALSQLQTHTYKFVTRYYKTKVPAAQRFGITTWNIADADSWIRPTFGRPDWPLPFDDNYQKKQAYQGIVDGLTGYFGYNQNSGQNIAGTYTDLASNGTAVTTNFTGAAISTDNDNSSVQNIGFPFIFNGTSYTNFILNTNGFIKFGVNIPSSSTIFYPTSNGNTNSAITVSDIDMLYPYNHDLIGTAFAEYRVYTNGVTGSRICTIQFKNVADKLAPVQYSNMNFQIRLYEAGNIVEFVYAAWAASGNAATSITAAVGIKGVYADSSLNIAKAAGTPWSTVPSVLNNLYFLTGNYSGAGPQFNTMNSVLPDAGRTFRFTQTAVLLPVNLIKFSAVNNGNNININWEITNQLNFSHYEIERSLDAIHFEKAGTIQPVNGSGVLNYQFKDLNAVNIYKNNGRLFYRLKMIDIDRTTTYSKIASVDFDKKHTIEVYPNPVHDYVSIRTDIGSTNKALIVTITDQAGRITGTSIFAASSGSVKTISTQKLAAGIYNVVVTDTDGLIHLKKQIVKQ